MHVGASETDAGTAVPGALSQCVLLLLVSRARSSHTVGRMSAKTYMETCWDMLKQFASNAASFCLRVHSKFDWCDREKFSRVLWQTFVLHVLCA